MLSKNTILFLSSFLIGIFFFLSGISKISSLHDVSKGFSKKIRILDFNFCVITIIAVIILEILAPIFIVNASLNGNKLLGYYSCISLILFTLLANLIYHFPPKKENYNPFMRNMAIIGGLLLLSLEFK